MSTVSSAARVTCPSNDDWIDRHSNDPEKIREFCSRHRIFDEVEHAVHLANIAFPRVSSLQVQVQEDPETGESWVRLFVVSDSARDEARAGYDRYISELVAQVPQPARGLIGLNYISSAP